MSYLVSFGYLLGITGIGSIVAGFYAAENGALLIGYGTAMVACGVGMWAIGRRYRN